MRCKGCDYPLWTIRARQCPECGRPFAPSDYEFAANAVEFHCPHCDQVYFGTDAKGHLEPREFDCVSCANRIAMDEMVLLPGEGVREDLISVPILPWLDRSKKWTAAWRVIGLAMTQPRRMMDITPVDSSVGRAWWFYTLLMLLVTALSFGGIVVMMLIIGGGAASAMIGVGSTVVIVYGFALLWGAVAHGLMKLFGAQPQHSIGRTYQALCYSSGVMVPAAIPCVGGYLWPVMAIWWMISAALAIGRAQRARAGRAAIAVILLPGLLYLGGASFIVYWMVRGISMAAGAGAFNIGQGYAFTVGSALRTHAAINNGVWPVHAAELLADGSISWYDLSAPGAIDRMPQTVGGVPAWNWDGPGFSPVQRRSHAAAMGRALPADVVAHRLGHVVFTYHGITPGSPQDPGLWLFFSWPDPSDGSSWIPGEQGLAMRADGMTESFDPSAFAQALGDQNALRAQHGLPPIPDPDTITEVVVAPPPGAAGPSGADE